MASGIRLASPCLTFSRLGDPRVVPGFHCAVALAGPETKDVDLRPEEPGCSPAEFGKFIADDTEKWGKAFRAANIKAE
jgi:hypothetical protein